MILYTLFCVITCDPLSALNAENQQMLYRVICGKAALRVGRSSGMYYVLPVLTGYIRMLCAFLISGLLSVLGMAWSKNKYFSLCMPCEYPDVETAAAKIVKVVDTVGPDEELTAKYEERYQQFRKLYPTVKCLYEKG